MSYTALPEPKDCKPIPLDRAILQCEDIIEASGSCCPSHLEGDSCRNCIIHLLFNKNILGFCIGGEVLPFAIKAKKLLSLEKVLM